MQHCLLTALSLVAPPPHPLQCAENGGNTTASASATSQATAVATAAAATYAAAFASLQSCIAPAPPSPQSTQCVVLPNTNLDGSMVDSTTAPSIGACCDLCKANRACNVVAFCPLLPPGCDNGYGTFYRSGECTLKAQTLASDRLPTWYAQGPNVAWTGAFLAAAA